MNNYHIILLIMFAGDCSMSSNNYNNYVDGLTEFETLIRNDIKDARCQLTCESLGEDLTEHNKCLRVCLTGDFSVCSYDWLCTGQGCLQACQPSVHKFTSTDLSFEGCRMQVPYTDDNADVVYIIGAMDMNDMWRLVRAKFSPGGQLYLKDDDLQKYLSLGVLGVSKAGIVERHNIPIEVFNCAVDSDAINNDDEDYNTINEPQAQPLFQELPELFLPTQQLVQEEEMVTDNYNFQEKDRIYLHELNNDDINRLILTLLTTLVLVCSCVLLVLFSLYLCRTRSVHDKLEDCTEVDSDSVHFLETGSGVTEAKGEKQKESQNKVNYEEIIEA